MRLGVGFTRSSSSNHRSGTSTDKGADVPAAVPDSGGNVTSRGAGSHTSRHGFTAAASPGPYGPGAVAGALDPLLLGPELGPQRGQDGASRGHPAGGVGPVRAGQVSTGGAVADHRGDDIAAGVA